jgi:c-di-GMP-binding flagellar brake protein YcgR
VFNENMDSVFTHGRADFKESGNHTDGRVAEMTRRNFVVGLECKKILTEAVAKHLPLKITNKHDTRWEVYKSSFLGMQGNRLVLSTPINDSEDSAVQLEDGQEIAVTFKKGYNKCLFVTRVIGPCDFETDEGETVEAMQILWPQQIEKFQRRAFNRAQAPPGDPIQVTFWNSDTPPQERKEKKWQGFLHDLSAGGLGITMLKSEMSEFQTGDQFEMWFVPLPGQEPLCLPVWYRHVTPMPETDQMMLGFQIVGLEISEEGRSLIRWISRIANVYQRQRPISEHDLKPTYRS